jgi:serine/threonine protein kinase
VWLEHLSKRVVNTELLDDYLLIEKLGEGSFASVFKAKDFVTGDLVAVKSITKGKLENDEVTNQLFNEIQLLREVSHPSFINMRSMYEDDHAIHLVLDLVLGETLFDYISRKKRLKEAKAARIIR